MLQNIATPTRPFHRLTEMVLHFTPNWFATSMGTGILSVALGQFHDLPLIFTAGELLFTVNIVLFATLVCLYAAKWVFHPRIALSLFDHPVLSMFLGTIPMALATLINGLLIYGPAQIGEMQTAEIALTLWMVDAVLAVLVGLAVPFFMFTRQVHAMSEMSAVWLLPIVAAEVAAASAGLLIPHMADAAVKLDLLMAALVLWACSVPLALSILVILFLRMVLHKLPPAAMAATSWLALGPIGTGALGLALVAVNGPAALAANGLAVYAPAIGGAALLGALLLWGYGAWWLMAALLITLRQMRRGLPFNLGWWAYTFPLGVFALATMKIGTLVPVALFHEAGVIMIITLTLVWCVVCVRTLTGVIFGQLFNDPCVSAVRDLGSARAARETPMCDRT
ncbi:MAG: TDT family transporter [Proteobacteria bacterium]|nr:TDT family transporter [Pseudomonadota bacterium]